ncbi:hypothetical protein FHL15_001617 [Xylaria flabelliformis]|uniref:MARVEL domain-containing protein n=1 Tax=Xylaria flabelliformis TaxID=2512241 RepID=A0A553IAW5_9PEZI|nr:hypothetical protein FHL15_001617 [Xylaria flabelliformis]
MYSSNIIILALRVAQFTLAFVVLGLSAFVTNWYNADAMSPAPPPIGWLLINVRLAGLTHDLVFHPYAALSLEFGNALFYFAGFIALSTFMGRLLFCRGSVCSAARADVAFGIFQFLLWAASASLAARELFKKGFRRSNNTQAPLGAPPMKEAPAP